MTVNWHNIRNHNGSQDQGFEELCSQLFHNEPPHDVQRFERRGYRDAGLECAHILQDNFLHGMQAKFFHRAPNDSEWAQIDKSVNTALEKNPGLMRLTICIPQNFDDPKIVGQKSAMDKWKEKVAVWTSIATSQGRSVEFILWDDTQLTSRLTLPQNRGKLWYFFNREEFTPEWFRNRVEEVAEDAKPRYTQELNVELPISLLFEGLGRTQEFMRVPRVHQGKLNHALQILAKQSCPQEAHEVLARTIVDGKELIGILRITDFLQVQPLPLNTLETLADSVRNNAHDTRSLLEKLDSENEAKKREAWTAAGKKGSFYHSPHYGELRHFLWDVASAAHDLNTFASSVQAQLANRPAMLVSGRAGKGKTHLLVDVARRRAFQDLPTIIMLGENFQDADPLSQIMEMVGVRLDRDEFLQALEAAAEASGGRLLIMIDALNEGAGLQLWPRRLAGFLKMIERYSWLGVVLSVRTTYEEATIPEAAEKTILRVEHEGFAARPEAAVRTFFAHYGINLPNVPLFNPEFTDPLFLKLFCKGLHAEGLHDIPEGHEGITRTFSFLVKAINDNLRKSGRLNIGPYRNAVREYLDTLADVIADSEGTVVPFSLAERLSHETYPTNGYQGSLLQMLISDGILATEMISASEITPRQEGIRFAYQRFSDHEIVRRLLAKVDADGLVEAFSLEGIIGQRFSDQFTFFRQQGLIEALSVQVPEQFGHEVAGLFQFPPDEYMDDMRQRAVAEALIESLMWRRKEMITDNTFEALQECITSEYLQDRYLEVLLTLSGVPGHPLNADRLHRILIGMSLTKRDAFWTVWLRWHHGEESAVDRLVTWGLFVEDKNHLSDDAVLLTCVALTWLTVSTIHRLRDRATKALVRMLTPRFHLWANLLNRFGDIDDVYVTERLYATAYGISLRLQDDAKIQRLAEDVYERIFATGHVPVHILVRDYARCVIERAVERTCTLSFDPQCARPPYGSTLPAEPPTREYFEGMVSPSDEWTDIDRAVAHIVDRFGNFDVSEYFGGPSFQNINITAIPLGDALPPSKRQIRKAWEAGLTHEQRVLWEEAERVRWRNVRITVRSYLDGTDEGDQTEGEQFGEEDRQEESAFDLTLQQLEASLDAEQQNVLHESILAVHNPDQNHLPLLDQELVIRWIIQRTLELGWTVEQFAATDASIERSHNSARRGEIWEDTFGAKYLWTAYFEVLARLVDNFHVLQEHRHDEVAPYEGAWDLDLRTIDPSYIPLSDTDVSRRAQSGGEWWACTAYDIHDVRNTHLEWLQDSADLPDAEALVFLKDSNGTEWVVLERYPTFTEQRKEEEERHTTLRREIWLQLRGYIIKQSDVDSVFAWMAEQDFMNHWMPGGGSIHGVFLGELYKSFRWKTLVQNGDWDPSEWFIPDRGCPAAVAPVKEEYSGYTEDASTSKAAHAMVPASLIVREALVHWSGEIGSWIDASGNVVLQDPSAHDDGGEVLLIERRFLEAFLQKNGYALVWTVLGEKKVLNWNTNYPWLSINGVVRYSTREAEAILRTEFRRRVNTR